MAYKLRINLIAGDTLSKRISEGKRKYSLTVFVDMIMLGETDCDRTFWVNNGDHTLKIIFNEINLREKYRTSFDLDKKSFHINESDAEFTVIAEAPCYDSVRFIEGKPESASEISEKHAGPFTSLFKKKRQ